MAARGSLRSCSFWRSAPALLILLALLLPACRPATPPPGPVDLTQAASTATAQATSVPPQATRLPAEIEAVRNAEYQLGAADGLQSVPLKDGTFKRGTSGTDSFLSVVMTEFAAVGDLDDDGDDEVAALVSENYGGTGVFVFLAVYTIEDGPPTFQASSMVDDRPQPQALSIRDGEIFLEAVVHRPDEPLCCPTWRTARHYRFVDSLLDLADYTTFTPDGKPRTIAIAAPVQGSDVFTSVRIRGSVTVAPFENNLAYRIYDVSGIELSAGAIPVKAADAGGPGTFDTLIQLGKALSGTVIRLEVQDVSAEDGSLLAMDSVELVVK